MVFFISPRTRRPLKEVKQHFALDSLSCNHNSHSNHHRHNHQEIVVATTSPRTKLPPHTGSVEIEPLIEAFEEFGWEDFPAIISGGEDERCDLEHETSPPRKDQQKQQQPLVVAAPAFVAPTVAPRKSALKKPSLARQKTQQRQRRSTNHNNKMVQFTSVHIREHASTVGDHDLCDGGHLPITLDWKYAPDERIFHVDDYEFFRDRGLRRRTPRGRLPKLTYEQRRFRLRRVSGISKLELEQFEQERIITVQQRQPTKTRPRTTVTKFPVQ